MEKKVILLLTTLAVTIGFSGCKRESMDMENSPTQEVTASFVFNVSTAASQTKQAGDDVQASGDNFRGIVDAKLMAYAEGDNKDGSILVADKDAPKVYDLSSLAGAGKISETQSRRILEMSLPLKTNIMLLYGRGGKKAYTAPTDPGVIGYGFTQDDVYGKLDKYVVQASAGSANFQLGKRLQDVDRYYTTEKLLAGILTLILNTDLKGANHVGVSATGTESNTGVNPYGFTLKADKYTLAEGGYPEISWKDYDNANGTSPVEVAVGTTPSHALYPLEEQLQYLYHQMVTIQTDRGELRAASGPAIINIVTDLWSALNAIRCAAPISEAEAVAKLMAVTITTRIKEFFAATTIPNDGAAVELVSFISLNNLIDNFLADKGWPKNPLSSASAFKPTSTALNQLKANSTTGVSAVSLIDFPFNFNMPRGVSYMAFSADSSAFYYPQIFNTSAMDGTPGEGSVDYDANSYYFPAELLYFGNSPVRVSDIDHKTADYPTTTSDWSNAAKWPEKVPTNPSVPISDDPSTWRYDWHGEHVVSSTRSVAMKYDINYGVAMLETQVGYSTTCGGYLFDNNHAVQALAAGYSTVEAYDAAGHTNDEPDKKIAITDDSFKLTGVIIGGQPQNVGWDFLPIKADSGDSRITTGFIYDKAVYSQDIPATGVSSSNYTVVFDNYNASPAIDALTNNPLQDKVFVALEFQNCTGEDFFGNCNLIKDEGFFYLIGELDPNTTTAYSSGIVWPTNGYVVPPYDTDGTSKEVTRVFVQDYVTSVSFKFGPNSLHYAYLTVPDLRSSNVTMGLSVDIKWSKGLVYNEIIIGGN